MRCDKKQYPSTRAIANGNGHFHDTPYDMCLLLAQSELDDAIAELCKAKLEKPKRLGELAQRWWSEVGV